MFSSRRTYNSEQFLSILNSRIILCVVRNRVVLRLCIREMSVHSPRLNIKGHNFLYMEIFFTTRQVKTKRVLDCSVQFYDVTDLQCVKIITGSATVYSSTGLCIPKMVKHQESSLQFYERTSRSILSPRVSREFAVSTFRSRPLWDSEEKYMNLDSFIPFHLLSMFILSNDYVLDAWFL